MHKVVSLFDFTLVCLSHDLLLILCFKFVIFDRWHCLEDGSCYLEHKLLLVVNFNDEVVILLEEFTKGFLIIKAKVSH